MAKTNVKRQTATPNPTAQELAANVVTDEVIDKELEEILKEVHEVKPTTDIAGMKVTEVKGKGKKTTPAKATTEEPKVTNRSAVYEGKKPITIEAKTDLVKSLPDIVTVKDLVGLFTDKFDGKFIRRHIRNKFIIAGIRYQSDDNSAKYTWQKNDPLLAQIVTYFTQLAK